jgi:hypothetical protein
VCNCYIVVRLIVITSRCVDCAGCYMFESLRGCDMEVVLFLARRHVVAGFHSLPQGVHDWIQRGRLAHSWQGGTHAPVPCFAEVVPRLNAEVQVVQTAASGQNRIQVEHHRMPSGTRGREAEHDQSICGRHLLRNTPNYQVHASLAI